MVLPFKTHPYTEFRRDIDGAGSICTKRQRVGQRKPYNIPAYYLQERTETLSASKSDHIPTYGGFANANTGKAGQRALIYARPPDFGSPLAISVLQAARAKFFDELSHSAELAVNLAERKQAVAMIASRGLQLRRFTQKIRHLDLLGAAAELSLDPRPTSEAVARRLKRKHGFLPITWRKPRKEDVANAWLEFQFGWKPMVEDIWNASLLVNTPIRETPVRARKSHRWSESDRYGETHWSGSYLRGRGDHAGGIWAEVGGRFRVTNPNAFLASRLGLINPLSLAWELVPFSFVVDWFVNVSDVLSSFTELHGIELTDTYHTQTWRDHCVGYEEWYIPGAWPPPDYSRMDITSRAMRSERKLGIPTAEIVFKKPWRLSLTRAATSISLLVQQLANIRK